MFDDEGHPVERHFAFFKKFYLFNVAQCDGLSGSIPEPDLPAVAEDRKVTALDHFITGCGIDVVHSEAINKAYYIPAEDRVQLPARAHFHSDADYYSVALHELTHATGHSSRLARPGITQQYGMQSPQYAFEELIAQLGSAFLCGHFGIHNEAFDAAYLSHWLQILKADKYAIFRASGAARRASEYLKQAYQEHASTLAVPAPPSSVITLPSRRIEVDDKDVELFGHQWPLGDHVKLDSTVDRGTFRAQISRLKQLGYHFDAASQTWNTTALAA